MALEKAVAEERTEETIESLDDYKARVRKEERVAAEKHSKELLLVWQAKDLAELEVKMDAQVQEGVQALVKKWQEDQKPPTPEQIAALVQQEYVEFSVKLRVEPDPNDGATGPPTEDGLVERTFVIRELPQALEREFYRVFKARLVENLPKLNAFSQKNMDKSFEEKTKAMLEAIDGGLDVLPELVALVLDPRQKKGITAKWVGENVSSLRQWNIIQAQLEANKLRDFLSQVSQSGQTMQTMTQPLSYQALLQQLPL